MWSATRHAIDSASTTSTIAPRPNAVDRGGGDDKGIRGGGPCADGLADEPMHGDIPCYVVTFRVGGGEGGMRGGEMDGAKG